LSFYLRASERRDGDPKWSSASGGEHKQNGLRPWGGGEKRAEENSNHHLDGGRDGKAVKTAARGTEGGKGSKRLADKAGLVQGL